VAVTKKKISDGRRPLWESKEGERKKEIKRKIKAEKKRRTISRYRRSRRKQDGNVIVYHKRGPHTKGLGRRGHVFHQGMRKRGGPKITGKRSGEKRGR